MENHNANMDSLSRRRALRFLLGIPPVLLGLDALHLETTEAIAAPVTGSSSSVVLSLTHTRTIATAFVVLESTTDRSFYKPVV